MQCGQADYCRFENGAQGSAGSSLWTFKLEFGIVHTANCSVCRSYMTHVAVANHSGDASFKDALNAREDRVSTAFLDGLQGGRQIQQENDSPVMNRYRDERDKALQDLNDTMKEMVVLRDRILVLEFAAQDPVSESVSKRRGEANIESPTKSDMSSVERLLLSPSEDDSLSTPFLSTTDDDDPTLIPNIPTTAEAREALQTETPDPAKPLGSNPSSIEPLGETTLSTEYDPESSALLLKTSSATPEPAKPSPQLSTCALSLSNPSSSNQRPPSVEPLRETKISTTIRSWANSTSTTSSATPKPEKSSPTCAISSSNPTSDQQSSSFESPTETNVSTANVRKSNWAQLARPPSATPKTENNPPRPSINVLGLSTLSTSDQQSSSVQPPGETTPNVSKSRVQLAKPSSPATPEPAKPLPRLSTSPLRASNPSTLDQLSSSIEPPEETNVSTADAPKSWAQLLSKPSSSATPEPEKPSQTHPLSSSNPSTSDQQFSSVEPPEDTNASTAKVPKSWAQLAKASSPATPNPEKPSPRPSTCALSLPIPSSSDQQSLATSPSPRPLTTIAHLDALIKAAHSGDDPSLTRIRAFCRTAHTTPRQQRTELQRYALLHWRNRSPSASSSVSSSVPSSKLGTGTVDTTVGEGTFSTKIHVDSSAWGIGFVMDGLWLAWKFSDSLTLSGNSIDNNWAEMLAVEVGLWTVIHWVCSVIQKEGDVINSLEIIVCSDNAGVVTAIKKRHSNFPPQQDILLRILDMISKYDIQLSTKWISSTDNPADGPSRGVPGPAPDLLPFIPPLPSYLSDTLLLL